MEVDRHGMEVLSRSDCLQLLRRGGIGRIVVTDNALPAAYPVNFCLLGDDVVFLTAQGSKLDAIGSGEVVAFEVDDLDPDLRAGWSVLVQGWADVVVDPDELAQVDALPLRSRLPTERTHAVRIRSERVSGRRLHPAGSILGEAPARVLDVHTTIGCPLCGSDELTPVTVGSDNNFVCNTCAACWRVSGGRVRRVWPDDCAGCSFKPMCTAAAARDHLLAILDTRTRREPVAWGRARSTS